MLDQRGHAIAGQSVTWTSADTTTLTVANCNDSGAGSLREAVANVVLAACMIAGPIALRLTGRYLLVINGNPAVTISDVRKVETVFKQGVGYDPAKLIASVQGKAGIW